ncbi:MAG: GDSL family lipase [Candidatus Kapabacteria bacterium]|nr:GDSL family lipase [Candidatus Kapabacteria bacterium]
MNKTIAVTLSILFLASVATYLVCTAEDTIYLQNANYKLMVDMYDSYKTDSARIVMLGDSHIQNVNWSELLGDNTVIGRGIRGDIVPGVLNRVYQVYSLQPSTCIIMVGINDIYANYSLQQLCNNYTKLLEQLHEHHITPIVCSTLYVCESYTDSKTTNTKVHELNTSLQEYCTKNSITFIDLNNRLSTHGYLDPKFSIDGIHCNAAAYRIWREELTPYIK